MEATPIVELLEDTWQATIVVCRALDAPQWDQPTDCPGWTVKDQVSHLIGTERMLQGLPASEADPGERPYVNNPIGTFNEREVELRRGRPGSAVLAEFEDLVALRLTTMRGADAGYFEQEVLTPTGPGTMLDFLSLRVLDSWVHEQDIRRAVDQPGHLEGGPAEHTTDRLLRAVPLVVGKRAAAPEGSTTVIDLTGPVVRHVPIIVEGGRAKVADPYGAGDPMVTVRTDSEAFMVLATGRRRAGELAARITIDGDVALGQAIVDHLNTMI